MKKNKKLTIISFLSIVVFIVAMFFGFSRLTMNMNKLKGNVTYPTTTGVKLSCDEGTLDVNQSTTCTLTGYLDNGATSVAGYIETDGNIEVSNITTTGWMNSGTPPELSLIYTSGVTSSQFVIATMNVKGLAQGSGVINFVGLTENDNIVYLSDSNYQTVQVDDASFNITIGTTSGGGTDPTPQPSSDNSLKSLKVGSVSIDLNNLNYTVPFDVNTVEIIAEANDDNATVTGDGTKTLTVGENNFPIIVTAENNSSRTYNLKITKEAANNTPSTVNTLSALTISNVTLIPDFSSDVTRYSGTVENNISTVNVSATRTNTSSSIVSGLGDHQLIVGVNTIEVVVKSESGSDRTYTVLITRKEQENISDDTDKSSDNSLTNFTVEGATITPEFDSSKNQNYLVIVDDEATSVTIDATPKDSKATVSPTEIAFDRTKDYLDTNVVVTAENGAKRYIPITIVRQTYYNSHKEEMDKNVTDQETTCVLELQSDIYQIDNTKLTIGAVDKNHSDITIYNNLRSTCGTISVKDEKVTLRFNDQVKEYRINRVFLAQTGQEIIRYSIVIAILLVTIVGLLIFMSKKKK